VSGGVLARVERGKDLDVVELIDNAGLVYIVHAHGLHDDERARMREAVLKLLRGLLAPAPSR
jgi:hypothetical protein